MKQDYWQTFYENGIYHIYNRTNNKELMFRKQSDKEFFLKQWKKYLSDFMETIAFCLMSNHFHFIVKIKQVNSDFLSRAMKVQTGAGQRFIENKITLDLFLEDRFRCFFLSYAHSFNARYDRTGSLFQKKFKRIELDSLAEICNKICYVHHNPIHHDAASQYNQWFFSSYNAYFSEKPTLVNRELGLYLFDSEKRKEVFLSRHEEFRQNWKKINQLDWEGKGDA